jgi:transcriptional regulator with XRE-family HTH domain
MKSPYTGGEVTLQKEHRTLSYRKEEFEVLYHFYVCKDSGEQFTDEELDGININQVHNQYRTKYGIPFPEEIITIREQYGLSASKMSEVLGFGANMYRAYEAGEVPSVSNGKFLQQIKDAHVFKSVLESSNQFEEDELQKLERKIDAVRRGWKGFENHYERYLLGDNTPNEFTGYRSPHLEKIAYMILFFAEKTKPFKTKLNKLLFYSDFYHYKKTCFSISGARYLAIQMGPVPKNFGGIFDYALNHCYVNVDVVYFENGNVGEKFVPNGQKSFDSTLFIESELAALEDVVSRFKQDSVKDIIEKSHEETAWKENVEGYREINYRYGFDLKSV